MKYLSIHPICRRRYEFAVFSRKLLRLQAQMFVQNCQNMLLPHSTSAMTDDHHLDNSRL